ncbi:chemotaxis response regulator protein-glutamate methylesterase [Paenibacillus puldeungensis]|uniref:Protein-glutamate methylesterase/protein-glutamine glutaminase n=1 Tax=Paenibacillus puldeungensis TaxID=696536 RepID=A0ABW3RYH2_9BACL
MPYRIMVVDDSAFMRKIITDLIEQEPAFKVEGTARNGREAIEQIAALSPDLVTMDVEMPEMNGLDALKEIMKKHPLPVIMLSGINEQGVRETIMALELGAFDFIRKPSATTSSHDIDEVGRELREQIKAAMLTKQRRDARAEALRQVVAPELPTVAHKAAAEEAKPQAQIAPPAAPLEAAASQPLPPAKAQGAQPKRPTKTSLPSLDIRQVLDKAKAAPGKGFGEMGRRQSMTPERNQPIGDSELKVSGVLSLTPNPNPSRGTVQAEPSFLGTLSGTEAARERPVKSSKTGFTDIVAIGTSTGGPKALKAVLEKIPADFPAPIVIVQHMPPNFTKSLAQRLNSLTDLTVIEAEEGMELVSGTAYIAPGGFHLNVVPGVAGAYRTHLTKQEPCNGHRPSVDVMYESLLPLQALKRHIVLLTGMGSDGAKVMKRLYEAGVTSTFAESEETCVVFGMPRSAIELKCVSYVLPLHEIGPKLVQVVK